MYSDKPTNQNFEITIIALAMMNATMIYTMIILMLWGDVNLGIGLVIVSAILMATGYIYYMNKKPSKPIDPKDMVYTYIRLGLIEAIAVIHITIVMSNLIKLPYDPALGQLVVGIICSAMMYYSTIYPIYYSEAEDIL